MFILEISVLVVVLIIFIIILCNYVYTNYYTLAPDVNWSFEVIKTKSGTAVYLARDALSYEIKHRGVPTKLDRSYGGEAVWSTIELRKKGLPYSRIIIRDKFVLVDAPYEHIPFIEYYISIPQIYITKNLMQLIASSKLYSFSKDTNEVIARSDSSTVNQAALYVLMQMIRNQITYDESLKLLKKIEADISTIKSDTSRGNSWERELYL